MAATQKIAFVCLHGAAKSMIAAEYCRRLAAARGLALDASSSGPEPDPEIPREVVDGLGADGFDVRARRPVPVTAELLADASHIVSFGCALDGLAPPDTAVERWDDCPAVSDDFRRARDFIVGRVSALVARL